MAQTNGGEKYTAFTFTENGKDMNRRIHRMEVQANDGHLYVLEGQDLPDKLTVNTGIGYKGSHLATILLNKRNFPRPPKGKMKSWPNPRDALHMSLGAAFLLVLLRIVANLAQAVP